MTTVGRLSKDGDLLITGEVNERIPVVNGNLKIRYIRDWLNGSTSNSGNHWVEIKAIDYNGTNVALNKPVTADRAEGYPISRITDGSTDTSIYGETTGSGVSWVQIDLGSSYNVSQIEVWHYYSDSRTYHNTKTEVSADGVNWYSVFDSSISGEYVETSAGKTINVPYLGLVAHYPLDGTDEPLFNGSVFKDLEKTWSTTDFIDGKTYPLDKNVYNARKIVLEAEVYLENTPSEHYTVLETVGRYPVYLSINSSRKVSVFNYGKTTSGYHASNMVLELNKWYKITHLSTDTETVILIDGVVDMTINNNNIDTNTITGLLIGSESSGRHLQGKIRNMKVDIVDIRKPSMNTNTTMTYDGITVEEGTTNIWSGGLNIYNNYGMPASLTDTGEKMFGQPVYRLAMTPTTQAHLDGIRTELGSHGVVVSGQTFLANTKYASSIYWRPINKQDVVFGGTASNVGWWGSGPTEYLDNGWRRYYQYRDGSNPSDASDSIFQSFYCPSLQLNETIYIDVCCPQTEQGKSFPTAYTSGSRGIGKLYYPISFSQNTNFTINIKVKYNRNDYIMDLFCDDTNRWNGQLRCVNGGTYGMGSYGIELLLRDLSAVNSNNYGSLPFNPNDGNYHNYTLVSINGYGTKVYADGNLVIDLPNKYVNYTSLSIGRNGMGDANVMGGTYKDLSIYDRSLTESEIKKLAKQSFSITKDGNLIAPRLVEKPNGIPSDAIHIPLDCNSKDRLQLISASDDVNTVYENGDVWVGSTVTNLIPNPLGMDVSNWNARENVTVTYGEADPFGGRNAVRVHPNSTSDNYFGSRADVLGIGSYSCSVWLKGNVDGKIISVIVGTAPSPEYHIRKDVVLTTEWQRIEFSGSTTADPLHIFHIGAWNTWTDNTFDVWVAFPQVISKPFSSPFANGTRDNSSLEYNLNRDYQLDWSKDWSIVYWKKPVGTFNNTLTGYNIESLGCNSNSVGGGIVYWGKNHNNNTIGMMNLDGGAIDPSKYFNNWRMVSLVKTGTTIVSKEFDTLGNIYTTSTGTTDTISNYYVTQYGYDLKLGGWDDSNPTNSYYKDLIIVKRALSLTELKSLFKTHMRAYKDKFQVKGNISEGIVL